MACGGFLRVSKVRQYRLKGTIGVKRSPLLKVDVMRILVSGLLETLAGRADVEQS